MSNKQSRRILVVEDDPFTVAILKMTLDVKYDLTVAGNAETAWQLLISESFALVLLDFGLPDSDGMAFFSRIKEEPTTSSIPIFLLTGDSKIESKVMALNMGGVDYLTKPFNPLELEARVNARLRDREIEKNGKVLRTGNLELRQDVHRVYLYIDREKSELKLTSTEFHLLRYFLENKNSLLTRAQILDAVWTIEANVTERTVDTHVSKLRKKLGTLGSIIESVHSEGYRLNESNREIDNKNN